MDKFRESLKTDLGREIYDWAPVKKPNMPIEIIEEIVEGFCIREQRKALVCAVSGVETPYVEIDGQMTLELHSQWRKAFYSHGYQAPILMCNGDEDV